MVMYFPLSVLRMVRVLLDSILMCGGFLLFTKQIGNFWQQDAVDCLQGLLTNEEVEIHVQVAQFIHRW